MIAKIYRFLIPASIRDFIYDAFLGNVLFHLRHFKVHLKSKFTFLFSGLLPKTEENLALAFIGKHGITSYPAPYSLDYDKKETSMVWDKSKDLPYIMHNGKKLYFPKVFNADKISVLYKSLMTEQDINSAHRYVVSYNELKGKTLLDIGSAEGIFSLDTIELVERVYLFECESFWVEALKATFEPWKDKVTLVEKYVGDKTEGIFITIDDFLKDKSKDNLFLKMDIEGAEQSALRGAVQTLKKGKNLQVAVCTYHKPEDPKAISSFLSDLGFSYEFTPGMLFWGKRLSKALIRGKKQ
jgi:Methyltransferase FkbM domain